LNTLFHIISKPDADNAKLEGFYKPASLEEDGFIHCAYANQVTRLAEYLFVGQTNLVILEIEKSRVGCNVVDEDLYEGFEDFPHIYGVLPWNAVIAIHDFPCFENGMFELPASIES
jgi:uncharacterized protein (DUF952 family)